MNFDQAVTWFHKAAAAGDSQGMCNLGSLYYQGRGVPQRFDVAMRWFRNSAAAGNDQAGRRLRVRLDAFNERAVGEHVGHYACWLALLRLHIQRIRSEEKENRRRISPLGVLSHAYKQSILPRSMGRLWGMRSHTFHPS